MMSCFSAQLATHSNRKLSLGGYCELIKNFSAGIIAAGCGGMVTAAHAFECKVKDASMAKLWRFSGSSADHDCSLWPRRWLWSGRSRHGVKA